jgi:hypothetical protein
MLTKEQEDNLRYNAKLFADEKNRIHTEFNKLIKTAQKLGYRINPKTGEMTKSIIV